MTESEYLQRLGERCAEWRVKYPSRTDELRVIVRRHLGISLRQSTDSDFARRSLEQAENEIIRVMQGWPGAEQCVTEPTLPVAPDRAPTPAPKDFAPSGRDRAAGVLE